MIPHVLLVLLQVVTLVMPGFRGRQMIMSTALVVVFLVSRTRPHFTNDVGRIQPFILNWAAWLSVLEKTLTSGAKGPEESFWRIDRPAREATAMRAFGLRKLKWAVAMLLNMRGIRWNYEVKNVERLQPVSQLIFLRRHIPHILHLLFMGDMVSEIWRHFMFSTGTNPKYLTVRSSSITYRFAWTWLCGLVPYYLIQIQYVMCSIICVATGISKPEVSFCGHTI